MLQLNLTPVVFLHKFDNRGKTSIVSERGSASIVVSRWLLFVLHGKRGLQLMGT